jgi:ribose/xylose/arabinose/galactoside ABC-type transport system permease subunit
MDLTLSPPNPNLSPPYLVHLAYLACGVLIIFYAWDRFNTPASNRSSTRQTLYLWGCAGYIVSALGVFVVLSVLLQVGAWRTMLLGPVDKLSLPPPFIATLAMTTLLSSIPLLKQFDGWILSTFLDWASMTAEVKRRAATMTPQSFHVTEEDVTALRDAYGDGSYGDTLAVYAPAATMGWNHNTA